MANNLSSVIKKNAGSKVTRKEIMQRSPVPWAVLLGITLIAAGFLVWPNASAWLEQSGAIKDMETEIPQLEVDKQSLTIQKDELEIDFNEKAEPFLKVADQRFPEIVDTTTIAQILEIYAILMKVNYRSNKFELNSVAVSGAQNVDGANYAETSVNLNVQVDRPMLEALIKFLQTSRVTDELRNKVIASGGGETASIEFLNLNKLPVGKVNSLTLNEERSRDDAESGSDQYNVQVQALFYSQPL